MTKRPTDLRHAYAAARVPAVFGVLRATAAVLATAGLPAENVTRLARFAFPSSRWARK